MGQRINIEDLVQVFAQMGWLIQATLRLTLSGMVLSQI